MAAVPAIDRLRARPPRVICLGLTAWDQTWVVDRLPSGGGKRRANDYRENGGGMAANAAAAVARLGGHAVFWGRAGDDLAGRAMRDELAAEGIDVSALRLFAGARSSVSGIVVDAEGERSIVNFRGAALPDDASWLPLADLRDAGALLADPRWPAGARAALIAARQAGVPTLFDGDVADREVFELLLPWIDIAVFSEPGLECCAGAAGDSEARLRRALALGCRVAAVTQGERGVTWIEDGALHHLDADRVDAVDTTGAGDVFHGACALAIGAGMALAEAFRFSCAVAALKCRSAGGRAGIPSLDATLGFIHPSKES